jgi:hypothetical protein
MAYNVKETLRLFGNEIHLDEVDGTQRLYSTSGALVLDADGKSITLQSDLANLKGGFYIGDAGYAIGHTVTTTATTADVINGIVGKPTDEDSPGFIGLKSNADYALWSYDNSSVALDSIVQTSPQTLSFLSGAYDGSITQSASIGITNSAVIADDKAVPDQSNSLFMREMRLRSANNYGLKSFLASNGDYQFLSDQSSTVSGHLGYYQGEYKQSTGLVLVPSANVMHLTGDFSGYLTVGKTFTITASLNYNGTYTIVSSIYNSPNTEVTVSETLATGQDADGTATFNQYSNDLWFTTDFANEAGGNIYIDDYYCNQWVSNTAFTAGGDNFITYNPTTLNATALLKAYTTTGEATSFLEASASSGNAITGLLTNTSAGYAKLVIEPSASIFTDTFNSKGIEYAADYSANFTGNSLVTKDYVNSIGGAYLPLAGGTMAGDIDMAGNAIHISTGDKIQVDGSGAILIDSDKGVICTAGATAKHYLNSSNFEYTNGDGEFISLSPANVGGIARIQATDEGTAFTGSIGWPVSLSAATQWNLPDATGTIALTSDITGIYLPLAGGTMSGVLNMDGNNIDFGGVLGSITNPAGVLTIQSNKNTTIDANGQTYDFSDTAPVITIAGSGMTPGSLALDASDGTIKATVSSIENTLDLSTLPTVNRAWTLPDADGTIALTSQLTGNGIYDGSGILPSKVNVTMGGNDIELQGTGNFYSSHADASWGLGATPTTTFQMYQVATTHSTANYIIQQKADVSSNVIAQRILSNTTKTGSATLYGNNTVLSGTHALGTHVGMHISVTNALNNYGLIVQNGSVGIGTTTPHASALIDITSSTQGLLPPRNPDPATNIVTPAPGLMAYDETDDEMQYYNGTSWGTVALTADIPTISGTTDTFPIFTSSTAIGDSNLTVIGLGGATLKWGGGTIQAAATTDTMIMNAGGQLTKTNSVSGFDGRLEIDRGIPLTVTRTWDMPDASGTVALTADIPTPKSLDLLNGSGAIATTNNRRTDYRISAGADALTLADGTSGDQIKIVCISTSGGIGTLTPTTLLGYTTITFNDVGDSVELEYGLGGWAIISAFNTTIA